MTYPARARKWPAAGTPRRTGWPRATTIVILACALGLGWWYVLARSRRQGEDALRAQARAALARTSGQLTLAGLRQPVEVLRDRWGVAHIYAQSEEDLFFAQGFVAAQDRLWQLELWRRKAEGRLAEIVGPQAVERDRYARLLRYRGDPDAEWQSYAPDTGKIVEAFVRGINAYIGSLGDHLPIEFQWLGLRPQPWTAEVCLSRVAVYPMTGNAERDLLRAALIHRLGTEVASRLLPADPPRPLQLPPGLDLEGISPSILSGVENATREDIPVEFAGSNNWAISGTRTQTGKPILANDPHRALQLPSLRYLIHLVGPGWNVIGAGEPALPGVSIGHNERIAFGLTIFEADQQDIYVEPTHPNNGTLYFDPRSPNHWQKMTVLEEDIAVRGERQPRRVQLKFTRHGPVIDEDLLRHRAFVLRWVGAEPGTAGYLAGLAISRARNWEEFRNALRRWKLPPENFVYADVDGNIGYQAAGLVPIRRNRDGRLPVRGNTLESEWQGFYSLDDLPHEWNPARGYVATANHNTLPPGEQRIFGFDWASPFRIHRIREVLEAARAHTVADSARLQADVVSLPARELLPLLKHIPAANKRRAHGLELLRAWDGKLESSSAAAALFEVWLEHLREEVLLRRVPRELWAPAWRAIPLTVVLQVLRDSDPAFFRPEAAAERNRVLAGTLDEAIAELEQRLGPEMSRWRWGALHVAQFQHGFGKGGVRAAWLNRGPIERGGDGNTVNATRGSNYRQSSGASFREILDLADWDRSLASNVPGQSGQPESPHYDDLLALWARDDYFPFIYSRAAVEKYTEQRLLLLPEQTSGKKP